jgi:tetratricopeptide (TPR) repeat protein
MMFRLKFSPRLARRLRSWRRWLSLRPVASCGAFFARPIAAGARRVRVWLQTRSARLLLQGLPALLVGVGVVTLLVLSQVTPADELQVRYLEQARAAFQARDFALAQVCYERVCQTAEDRPDVLFGLAQTAQAQKQPERAALLMSRLAPPDRQGYGEAHLWNAARLLPEAARQPPVRKVVETHLLRALRGELRNPDVARWLLGDLYVKNGQLDQAEVYLTQVAKTRPHARLRLAELYARRGDVPRARQEATFVVNHFRLRTKQDIYDHQARMGLGTALTFLEEFPEAVAVLSEGWWLTNDPAYKQALGGVHAAWCGVVESSARAGAEKGAEDKRASAKVLALLERGLSWHPANLALLHRLLGLVRAGGEEAAAVRRRLLKSLARGESPAIAHFVLGVDAHHHGKHAEARVHWERSHQLAPDSPDVANNLAFLLAASSSPDLPRALKLVELALKHAPGNPTYRDTRGRIYLKMGQWKEALADLEAALPAARGNPDLHRALAEVYERLGIPDLAAEHRRLAEQPPPAQAPTS